MSLIALLVAVIVICLIWWGLSALMGAFGIGDPIATVVRVIFVVVVILWLLSAGFGMGPGIHLR